MGRLGWRAVSGGWRVGAAIALLAMAGLGCGNDDAPASGPSDKLCTTGAKRCIGNAAAACAADGLSFTLVPCGTWGVNVCASGACVEAKCTPGQSACFDDETVTTCDDTGTLPTEAKCAAAEACVEGACRPKDCTAGEKACGWRKVVTCKAGGAGWEATACASDEICDPETRACVKEACRPGSVECKDALVARACRTDASGWVETACGDGQECNAEYGVCLPKLATPPADTDAGGLADVAGGDADDDAGGPPIVEDEGPKAELEPLDIAECTVDGEKIVFKNNLSATYVEKDQDLRVSMDKGLMKIEISLKPLEELDIGHWTSDEATEVNVAIFYNDGSELPAGAQFKYISVDYDVELLKFQDKGGRVAGTFSGTFTPDGGATTIPFTDCKFDVKRHD